MLPHPSLIMLGPNPAGTCTGLGLCTVSYFSDLTGKWIPITLEKALFLEIQLPYLSATHFKFSDQGFMSENKFSSQWTGMLSCTV